jgi:hypothetical protein
MSRSVLEGEYAKWYKNNVKSIRNNSLKKLIFLLYRLIGYEGRGMVLSYKKKIRISDVQEVLGCSKRDAYDYYLALRAVCFICEV